MNFHARPLISLCLILLVHVLCPAQRPELVVQMGHPKNIKSIAFSPDGKIVASGSEDDTIKLWDTGSGQEVRTIAVPNGMSQVVFSPDGKTLAAGGQKIITWEVDTARELSTFDASQYVSSLAFTPNGKFILSGGNGETGNIKCLDVASGQETQSLTARERYVTSVAVSNDGKLFATLSTNNEAERAGEPKGQKKWVQIWDFVSGRELHAFAATAKFHFAGVAFASGGKTLAGPGDNQGEIKIWDVTTGREVRTLAIGSAVYCLAASPAGDILITCDGANSCLAWEASSGKELKRIESRFMSLPASNFSPDGRLFALSVFGNEIDLLNVQTGKPVATLKKHSATLFSLAFSPNGRSLAVGSERVARLWDLSTGSAAATLRGHDLMVDCVAVSPDGNFVVTEGGNGEGQLNIWNAATGERLRTVEFKYREGVNTDVTFISFSPDSRFLVTGGGWFTYEGDKRLGGSELSVWNLTTDEKVRAIKQPAETIRAVALSPDGTIIANSNGPEFGDGGDHVMLWEAKTGKLVRTLQVVNENVYSLSFSPDGKLLAGGGLQRFRVWDASTGAELSRFEGSDTFAKPLTFSPNGRLLAAVNDFRAVKIWDVASGKMLLRLAGHPLYIRSIAFSPDSKMLATAGDDAKVKLWEVETGRELANLIALDDDDWAVVTGDGRFDASSKGQHLLHWLVGREVIELSQLKERYFEPGLLAKVTGHNGEPLRNISAFDNVRLFPSVAYEAPPRGDTRISIKLTDRGGGIGRVQVFVNDKEVAADARGLKVAAAGAPPNVVNVDLAGAPVVAGSPNTIRVVAWNAEGYLSGRGEVREWVPEGVADNTRPQLYAVIAGVSEYSSPALNLRFPAKDAADMAKALEIGAKRLFGAENVHLTLLGSSNDPRAVPPTKANFRKAFDEMARTVKPWDVFVVYLAGHGAALPGSDSYFYLTQEARSVADLNDSEVRAQVTLSSDELTEWVKRVPALKQLMVLDTCAAGQAAMKLVERRSVSGDQIRAIERLKDRTGFYVLMGSAADAVSYEASQYGQGLLTYALLQGMKGAALRDDQYVDVSRLFQYAADQVPLLATNIGGIQKPLIAAPRGTSFDVGRLEGADKEAIPLSFIKPLVLRPVLINPEEGEDSLGLMAALRRSLNEESYATMRSPSDKQNVVYVDADELPGAVRPTGTYSVVGQKVVVRLFLNRDGKKIGPFQVEGMKDDQAGLVARLTQAITGAVLKPDNWNPR